MLKLVLFPGPHPPSFLLVNLCMHSPFFHQQIICSCQDLLRHYQITTIHQPFPVINALLQFDPFLWVYLNLASFPGVQKIACEGLGTRLTLTLCPGSHMRLYSCTYNIKWYESLKLYNVNLFPSTSLHFLFNLLLFR